MRILSITAGAADMYCGSCLRDNALAAELIARGHDVLLLPLYTPTRTDERNVSDPHVFYGGISVFLQELSPLFRRTPRFLDRLWDAPSVIRAATSRAVSVDPAQLGDLTLSVLRGEDGHQHKELRKLIDWLKTQPRPDIIVLPNSLLIGLAAPLRAALGRPVCCTLQGEDQFLEGLPRMQRAAALDIIRAKVPDVDRFLPVSEYYVDFMADYLAIPTERLSVLPLGINLDGYPERRQTPAGGATLTVGYFARVAPGKGLHVLADAFRALRERLGVRGARLEVAGYLAPEHRGYLAEVEAKLSSWGLEGAFAYRGVIDRARKIEFLSGLDVFSVPSTYPDPKGIFVLEAMACGVPVVQPRHGAFPEILERTGGGITFEPHDADRLADELAGLHREPDRAEQLRRQGAYGVRKHYSAARMADRAIEFFGEVVASAGLAAVS
ncbi:MAG: glycosyltransferase family 4 protein [Vicinamibacterales bacterium]|jgi:glycosyltransferase involved in cell wall biosynthesis|nr:hexosyltransferase [Acidobacteriota bacterium]MDP7293858.1 glycosyltransferase family 4 protein [Vicinamibacterales bacterium]MDP7472427.1 glycosyltransferase family 4 protein [Vicinamibacterales bacterium]MDP7670377.1 glycosyltransferase family 4 protein [Vicinamibacterales bacterium]HJO38034.1 glycosyltransferase family 4 protein [Vicinamibacterales bacterium]|tara:strand:- start:412 stop:1728 length:1317 start_codon:yes stop_codon:yes gene_type:complete